jgi:hypothetical protein
MKPPWVEDYELCYEKNIHLFIHHNDGNMRCYYCRTTYEEFINRIQIEKSKIKKKKE